MSEYDCHFKCKELSAENVQRMFLECDDIKVLENSSGFLEFMKRYSRFDGKMITETIEKLNLRLGKIIGCKLKFFWDENSEISQIKLLLKK
jgi:hypothetical protein